MKRITIDTETSERIKTLLNSIVDVFYDGFGYEIVSESFQYSFFNQEVSAEGINSFDNAKVLTSKISNRDVEHLSRVLEEVRIVKIMKVSTILTFSKLRSISFLSRMKEYLKHFSNRVGRIIFGSILFKKEIGYSYICTNPEKAKNLSNQLHNQVECGFILVGSKGQILPIFPNNNLMWMYEYKGETFSEILEKIENAYLVKEEYLA